MLSPYTLKYIDLLSEEVELFKWAEQNMPSDLNISEQIEAFFVLGANSTNANLCSARVLEVVANQSYPSSYTFGEALLYNGNWAYSKRILEWVQQSSDISKACLFLAKTVNGAIFRGGLDTRGLNEKSYLDWEQDLDSLPLSEPFLKTTTSNSYELDKETVYGFKSFDLNSSFYSKLRDWSSFVDKDKFLRWFLLPKDMGDVSIQITQNSYTQIGNPSLINDGDMTGSVNLLNDLIYFTDYGDAKKSSEDGEVFSENIEPLEAYALEIETVSRYAVLNVNIDTMLDRLRTAANINSALMSKVSSKSISYKLVFSIEEQQSVVVPSADMYQSLLYMKAMGTENVGLFYDNFKKRIVIRGKDFSSTIQRAVTKENSRLTKMVDEEVTIPTFAIIYEQKIEDLTAFSPVEYIQFFNPQLAFRDKYDLLNTKRNAPIDLPQEFMDEYPVIAATYSQQTEVALSLKDRDEKYDYASNLIDKYTSTYTRLVSDAKGELVRETIPTEEWTTPNYVLKVHEAYWVYNSNITNEELLAFFISKGNDVNYRVLCLKILGVDYHLFEQPIINALLKTKDIFVSKLDLDEANVTAEVKYESKNSFISENIYDKEDYVKGNKSGGSYNSNLGVFFGAELGSDIYDKTLSTIEEAISSRFVPSLVPNVRNEEEAKSLELNIDIYSPLFFSGTVSAHLGGDTPKMYRSALITGKNENAINMVYSHNSSKYYEFGHFDLFKDWLIKHQAEIVGGYTWIEIVDAYVFPKSQVEYCSLYLFPNFKDGNGDTVGFEVDGTTTSLKTTIQNATEQTKIALKSLNRISSYNHITSDEVENIRKDFVQLYKERFWDARREGRRLFNVFLRKGIDSHSRQLIDLRWNKMFNNYAKPVLDKVPIFPSHSYLFGKKSDARQFRLMEAQTEGIRHLLSRKNSGLLLHEVGFGKTTSSITAISSMMNTGESSRVLFIVPKSVYDKFYDEIKGKNTLYGLLPNINVQLLDNLRQPILTNKKNGIKIYSDEELETIEGFKKFNKEFKKIVENLKRGKITLVGDPLFHIESGWDSAFAIIKSELKEYVSNYEGMDILTGHLKYLEETYSEIALEWSEYYEPREDIIEDRTDKDSTESEIKKAKKEIERQATVMSNKLYSRLKQYINFVAVSLIDDLGHYKPEVMAEKTILIAMHSALESIRPSADSIMRALMFKEGLGEPETMVKSLNVSEWALATGLSETKCKSAINILTRNPISLEKLNIDTVVIDEIHNFNNVVRSAGSKGWFFSKETPTQNSGGKRGTTAGAEYYILDKVGGRFNMNRHDMRYDGKNSAASDSQGKKLSAAAVCFDVQYRSRTKNNVILLSATPFTDSPFQVVSVLGMANYQMLTDNGISSAWDFFNNYVDEAYKWDLRHDGGYGLFIDINGYYNDKALSNLITNVANVKITDEEIEKNRPKKAIIPQNKIAKDTENEVAETTSMGDWFSELEDVNSRVTMSEAQDKFAKDIKDYLSNDDDNRPVKDIFPINESRITDVSEDSLNEEIELLVAEQMEEAKSDPDNADMVVSFLESLYNKGKYAQHPILGMGIDDIKVKILKETVEKPDEESLEAVKADVAQFTSTQKLMGKAIGCQQAQQSLVISPYFVNLGNKAYTSPYLEPLEPNPSKVFVESSPKLMYVIKAIRKTIAFQQGQLERGEIEKIGGQVVYFDRHNFDYGGKSYNAFELLAEYIAINVDGISSDTHESGEYEEIGIIEGGVKDDDTTKGDVVIKRGKTSLRDGFNFGDIKVLIGSKAIKEGIDLQGNSHTMYICESEFSPEVAMQLEGRIWRQKNPYDVVRIIYVLAMNTIDSFIYSKINRKVSMIKRMLELGVYEMNTTQFVIDTKEMLIQLESDPDKLTQIEFQDEKSRLTSELGTLEKKILRLKLVRDRYTSVEAELNEALPYLNSVYNAISDARETIIKGDLRREIKMAKNKTAMNDMTTSKFKGTVKEWLELPANKSKYDVSDKEVNDLFEEKSKEREKQGKNLNPLPKLLNPITIDTPFSTIEIAVQKIKANLNVAENFEASWRRMSEEQQNDIRNKENKSTGEIIYLAFYDASDISDIAAYLSSNNNLFVNDVQKISIVETYQSFVKNEGKTIEDIDSIIEEFQEIYDNNKAVIDDPISFKASLRENWVKALAERKESFGGDLDDLVDTLESSQELIRIRKKQ